MSRLLRTLSTVFPGLLLGGIVFGGDADAYNAGFTRSSPLNSGVAMAVQAHVASDDLEARLAELSRQEQALEQELDELGPQIDTADKRMLARGRAYYRLVRAGLLPVGGGFQGLVDHAATTERLRAALSRDAERKRGLQARVIDAAAELKALKAARAPLEVQHQAVKRARLAMQQADEREAAFLRAFGGSGTSLAPAVPHRTIYGTTHDTTAPATTLSFASSRGQLGLPLSGRTELVRSQSLEDRGTLQLRASSDTPVRAVHAARVVFVGDTNRGATVVLDHGEGYFSVYANLQRIEVSVGEVVAARSRLGWVLRRANQQPILHFEIRHNR